MKRLAAFAFIVVVILLASGCGTPVTPPGPNMGTVTGYVTDTQGGAALVGATVTCQTYTTTTNSEGFFSLRIEADKTCNLVVTKENRATSCVQDLIVGKDETVAVTIPNFSLFNPSWSLNPPVIAVTGVDTTRDLTGTVTLHINTTGERVVNKIYVYVGTEQRSPRAAQIFDSPSGDCTVNTALYPNGPSYFRVLVYDDNENATTTYIPITINNGPAALSVMGVSATSYGVTVGYYAAKRVQEFQEKGLSGDPYIVTTPKGTRFDLRSAPAGTTVTVGLVWAPAARATSYKVLRSLDGTTWKSIGVTASTSYNDYSPYVTPGLSILYKVIPVNGSGIEGVGITRAVVPLAPFNVTIGSPADGDVDVSLQPTFTWTHAISGTMPAGASFATVVQVVDATSYIVMQDEVDYAGDSMVTSYPSSVILEPGHVYSWDVIYSHAYALYVDQADGYSEAISYAGAINADGISSGSTNGENMFTTIAPVAE